MMKEGIMDNGKLLIIAGHYGSGKTEYAVNKALDLAKKFGKAEIADLDIVNTYFRTREITDFLDSKNVKVYDSNLGNTTLDLPALSPAIMGVIENLEIPSILDVGGNAIGARVLARFGDNIFRRDYELLFVVNANRPETQTAEETITYLRSIEDTAQLKVTGLVNTTHMLKDTEPEDVIRGHKLCMEISKEIGVPIYEEVCMKEIAGKIDDEEIKAKLFPIDLYMRANWMS